MQDGLFKPALRKKPMSDRFKTIFKTFSAEIIEKKSRFIATITPASTEQEALNFIKSCKKTYHDARHNCSAYIIGTDGRIKHSSDDGEPSGTAGKPMLTVLDSNGLYNTAAVVTRYFGGILLGTGGLVRAYTRALEKCIESAELKTMFYGTKIKIEASYTDAGKLQHMFSGEDITVLSADYTDKVAFNIIIPSEDEAALIKTVSEMTASRSVPEILERSYYTL
jgi:uncharacterized YigZ family protein